MLILFVSMGSLTERGYRCARPQVQDVFRFVHRSPHDLNVRDAALDEGYLVRISARLSSLPEERSSSTTTLWPRRTSSSTVFETDEAGAARDEVAHPEILLLLRPPGGRESFLPTASCCRGRGCEPGKDDRARVLIRS